VIDPVARGFAAGVAARYAAAEPRAHPAGRVVVHGHHRAIVSTRRASTSVGLTLHLIHRVVREEGTRTTPRDRTHALIERVERHVAATRHAIERTLRVEQVPLRAGALRQLASTPAAREAHPGRPPIVVPPLTRVLRRPSASRQPNEEAAPSAARRLHQSPAAAPAPIDVARLTDDVMRNIDKRLAAWRERRGRV
jgi:hypothetical protein